MCQIQSKELLEAFEVYMLKHFLPKALEKPEYNLSQHSSNLLKMVRQYRDHRIVSLAQIQIRDMQIEELRQKLREETFTELTDQEKHELGIPI